MEGLVIAGTNNFFTVERKDEKQFLCSIKGKVLKLDGNVYNPLCPGDIVEFEEVEDGISSIYSEGVSLRSDSFREGAIFRRFRSFTEERLGNHLYLYRLGKRG